jgi:peptidoglycan hydrolase-like protein with peptidoglycan-binding domain
MNTKLRLSVGAAALCLVASLLVPAATMATTSSSAVTNITSASIESLSIDQLTALIAKLQQRLAEMKKAKQCFVSDKDLSIGDGEDDGLTSDVRRLQDFLREKGLFAYKSTGYFGKATRNSVIAFQKGQGIAQSGEFDTATRAKAHGLTCKVVVKSAQPKVESQKPKAESEKQEAESSGKVSSIALSVTNGVAHWSVNGFSANGFKVVWSKNAGPTYPTREGDQYQYFSESSRTESDPLSAFNGSGTYHVRVCEYVGVCGVYSNEVEVTLQE